MMLVLGTFRFSLDTAAYAELERTAGYRFAAIDRAGAKPTLQPMGAELATVRLAGKILPGWRGKASSVDDLVALANAGAPLVMADGAGRVWGKWVLERVSSHSDVFLEDGTPRRVAFSAELKEWPG